MSRRAARAVEGAVEAPYAPPLEVRADGRLGLKPARPVLGDPTTATTVEELRAIVAELLQRLTAAGLIER